MYNIVVKRFKEVEEVQVFPIVVQENRDALQLAKDWHKFDATTGERFPLNVNIFDEEGKRFYDVFRNEYGWYRNFRDESEECLRRSARRSKSKIKDIAYCNEWDWFISLTFNGEKVNRYDYDLVVQKMTDWLKNNKRVCRDMKYIVVPEMHLDGAWHFHGLFSNCDDLQFTESNIENVYNVGKFKLGWTTATKIQDTERASTYISKYICKDVIHSTYNRKRYWYSRNCDLPQVEKYFCDCKKVKDALGEVLYEKQIESPTGTIRYYRTKIYTTNTTLFRTND